MDLKEMNGRKIEYFANDEAQIGYHPKKGCKYVFKYEQVKGRMDFTDLFYILHIDENGNELERFDYLSKAVSHVRWANVL